MTTGQRAERRKTGRETGRKAKGGKAKEGVRRQERETLR
jgi:hypothetical protein